VTVYSSRQTGSLVILRENRCTVHLHIIGLLDELCRFLHGERPLREIRYASGSVVISATSPIGHCKLPKKWITYGARAWAIGLLAYSQYTELHHRIKPLNLQTTLKSRKKETKMLLFFCIISYRTLAMLTKFGTPFAAKWYKHLGCNRKFIFKMDATGSRRSLG